MQETLQLLVAASFLFHLLVGVFNRLIQVFYLDFICYSGHVRPIPERSLPMELINFWLLSGTCVAHGSGVLQLICSN